MEIGIDPVAFTVGPLSIHWYGILIALAVLVGLAWALRYLPRRGVTVEFVLGGALLVVPLGVIFARLVHVIDKSSYYSSNPGEILGFQGLAIFGAILGGLLGAWIYCRRRGLPFAPLADVAIPGIILAQAVGRIGCIFAGCCYGEPTSVPWAFTWTHPGSEAILNTPLHPTQLYELVGDLVIFALLYWVLRGRLKPDGAILAAYLALYSLLTFVVRFWRADTEPFVGPVHEGQLLAGLIGAIAIGWLVFNARWSRRAAVLTDVAT